MAIKNMAEVQQTGIVPTLKKGGLRVTLQATGKTEIKNSKNTGRRQAIVPLEIIAPTTPIVDAEGKTVIVAGLTTKLYIQLDDKGLAQGTAELHRKANLPMEFDIDSDEACLAIYNNMCIEALLYTEEQELTEWDPIQGKEVPARDANGNLMKGQNQWRMLSVRDIIGEGKRISDFTTESVVA